MVFPMLWHYRKSISMSLVIIMLSLVILHAIIGDCYEKKKLNHFVITVSSVYLTHYIIFQHIGLTTLAYIWSSKRGHNFVRRAIMRAVSHIYWPKAPIDILKLQLYNLKIQLPWAREHYDERKNYLYLMITRDLWLFTTNFILVLILTTYTINEYIYHNTNALTRIFSEGVLNDMDPESLMSPDMMYEYLNKTFIQSMVNGTDYNGQLIQEPGWMDFQINKLVSVVRFRQSRLIRSGETGEYEFNFDCSDFLPGWRPETQSYHYVKYYRHVYSPWLCERLDNLPTWLLAQTHFGYIYDYWNPSGYKTYLHRNTTIAISILNFLQQYRWIDEATASLVIDFSMYNVDSDIFSICTMMFENTPFGVYKWSFSITSLQLEVDFHNITYTEWFLFVLYTLLWIKIVKTLVQNYWYEKHFWSYLWNYIDIGIIISCILIIFFIILRMYLFTNLMYNFERLNKLKFVDFRPSAFTDYIVAIFKGLLITLTTIRIWRLLQFARIFRLFTKTLAIGASAYIWTLISMFIILMATSLSAQLVNGRRLECFSSYFSSLTTILSISFGFSNDNHTQALTAEHDFLAVILQIFMMIAFAIIMMNMFTTLVFKNFGNAYTIEEDVKNMAFLSYHSFLRVEHSPFSHNIRAWLKNMKTKRVQKLIIHKLLEMDEIKRWKNVFEERKVRYKRRKMLKWRIIRRQRKQERHLAKIHRLSSILRLQTLMLKRLVVAHVEEYHSDQDSQDEVSTNKGGQRKSMLTK